MGWGFDGPACSLTSVLFRRSYIDMFSAKEHVMQVVIPCHIADLAQVVSVRLPNRLDASESHVSKLKGRQACVVRASMRPPSDVPKLPACLSGPSAGCTSRSVVSASWHWDASCSANCWQDPVDETRNLNCVLGDMQALQLYLAATRIRNCCCCSCENENSMCSFMLINMMTLVVATIL